MSDLEKQKAGERKEGYYYIKANRTISFVEIDYYHIFGETEYWNGNDNEDVLEVLAPVPTYAELQELKSKRDKLAYDLGVADTKNGELLRLLKEWVEAYPVVAVTCDLKNFAKIKELLDKTNEVLK